MPTYQELIDEVYDSPSVSYALKHALKAADKRDIVDALYDAEVLVRILRCKAVEKIKIGGTD